MKWILALIAIVAIVGGVGCSVWFLLQNDELKQDNADISSANARLTEELSAARANATEAKLQLDVEKIRANNLQVELNASKDRVAALEAELEAIQNLLDGSSDNIASEISRLNAELAQARAELAALTAANDTAIADLKKVSSPRHFYSIEELRDWLARDDTNTNPAYASLGLADKAFILQVKALRDGYILSTAIDADAQHIYSWNIAIVGPSIYVVIADTDEVIFLANFEMPPAQPPLL